VSPFLWVVVVGREELRKEKDDRSQQSLGGVIEECVLPVVGAVAGGIDDGLADDLGVLLRLGLGREVVFVGAILVHVLVDQMEKVVAVRASGVSQVNDSDIVAVVVTGDGAVVAEQIALGVCAEEAHAGGTGILQVGVKEESSLSDARRTNHEGVDIVRIHQRRDLVLLPDTAEDDALLLRQLIVLAPRLGAERNAFIGTLDLFLRGEPGCAVLPVAHGAAFDPIEGIVMRQQ